ncbi:hypothetical protein QUB63_17695 [Microcoleus sp. ARI1-B5]|uniref:hypothetical protein n=1 Tax=unclassified Microcoleus TaxID=2642155 RepID=UPI002FD63A27
MSLVIPRSHPRQASSKQSRLLDYWKTSQDVCYSSYHKFHESGSQRLRHQSLVVLVNSSSFHCPEATERGLRTSFAEDVSISRTRLLPHPKDLNKSLVSPAREQDVLDWDLSLENPPLKPAATIELEFEYGGRSKPIPVSDPWDE